MKKLLIIPLLFVFQFVKSQTIIYTPMAAAGYQFKYLKADSGLALPFFDTSFGRGVSRPGPIVISTRDTLLYYWNGIKWNGLLGGGGSGTTYVDSVTISGNNLFWWKDGTGHGILINKLDSISVSNDSLYACIAASCTFVSRLGRDTVDLGYGLGSSIDTSGRQKIFALHSDGLVSGGIVSGAGGLSVNVTLANYYKNFNPYTSPQIVLTDSAADGTYDRKDIVVVDTLGKAYIKQGVPGASPISAQANPSSEIKLADLDVPAEATSFDITHDWIYQEGTEWDTAHSGTIAIDWQNTAVPHSGTYDIYVNTFTDSSQIIFTKPSGTDTIQSSSIFNAWLYGNILFKGHIQAQFFNSSTAVSTNTDITSYFSIYDSTNYQLLSVPQYALGFSSIVFNKVILTLRGSDLSGAGGFYLDDIEMQHGINNPSTDYSNKVDSTTISGGNEYWWAKGVSHLAGSVGSTGSSGISKLGSPTFGLTRTNDSTYAADTVNGLTSKLRGDSLAAATNLKVNISDTSSMLSHYFNNNGLWLLRSSQTVYADSAGMASYFLRRKDSSLYTTIYQNSLKLNITDTTNKWVNTITKNAGGDSIVFYIGSTRYAILDRGTASVTQTYTSGSSVTINNNTTWLIVNPSSIKSTLTITMPATPTDAQSILISFGGTVTSGNGVVTSLTISPNSGQTLIQSTTPSFVEAGDAIQYRYNLSNTSWYRTN